MTGRAETRGLVHPNKYICLVLNGTNVFIGVPVISAGDADVGDA